MVLTQLPWSSDPDHYPNLNVQRIPTRRDPMLIGLPPGNNLTTFTTRARTRWSRRSSRWVAGSFWLTRPLSITVIATARFGPVFSVSLSLQSHPTSLHPGLE